MTELDRIGAQVLELLENNYHESKFEHGDTDYCDMTVYAVIDDSQFVHVDYTDGKPVDHWVYPGCNEWSDAIADEVEREERLIHAA